MANVSNGRTNKKSNRGQIAIESLLLMVVLLGLFMALTKTVRDRKMVSKLVEGPIKNVAAMAAYGTWQADGCKSASKPKQTIGKCHPNSAARTLTSAPRPQ